MFKLGTRLNFVGMVIGQTVGHCLRLSKLSALHRII